MGNYGVYRHIRLDTNVPFYIGKGLNKRAFSKRDRNQYWHNIVNKYGYEVEIMLEGLTNENAIIKEKEFIKLYKVLGYCEANLTNGGEGLSGLKHTVAARKKMSDANKNRKREPHTLKTKRKLSKALKTAWQKRQDNGFSSRPKTRSLITKQKISKGINTYWEKKRLKT